MALAYDQPPRPDARTTDSHAGALSETKKKLPRTDAGTFALHWLSAAAVVASLLTGLRIAADDRDASISRFLSPVLPQGEVWTVHFIAGLTLFFCAVAYMVYIRRAGLQARIALQKARKLTMPVVAKHRWDAVNVLLHWVFFGLVVVLASTGVALYAGYGGALVSVHLGAAYGVLTYILAHLIGHFGYGGWRQLLRVFLPTRLVANRETRPKPALIAVAAAIPAAIAFGSLDFGTRDTLDVRSVAQAPKLDGLLDDAAWQSGRPVFVRTMQGASLGGTGESRVEIRAVHDAENIYFAFRWEDPSRSLRRLPIIKQADGWHMTGHDAGSADVVDHYEDKFAVIFAERDAFGSGGVSHLGPKPVADKPPSLNDRGLHYTTDGAIIEMWQWKSSRGGLLGTVDDMFIGPPQEPTPDQAARRARYQGGYWPDPGHGIYSYNFPFDGPGGYRTAFQPTRLPKDVAALQKAMGNFDMADPDASVEEGSVWWLNDENSVPYSKELDATIPVGTVLPGVILSGKNEGDRGDLQAARNGRTGIGRSR